MEKGVQGVAPNDSKVDFDSRRFNELLIKK
jgi:hypothetical protein